LRPLSVQTPTVFASASSHQRGRQRGVGWVIDHAEILDLVEWGGAAGMSFFLSFHLGPLGPTGAHWLDDLSDLIPYGGLGVKSVVGLA
jgi:hypothetical protein